uniref:Uncharacterized protein n=1 Tax=Oryza brachyantha TaxID=4533 RepID=J3LGD3_ORYBR
MAESIDPTVALPPSPAVHAVEEGADDDHRQNRDHYRHPIVARVTWCKNTYGTYPDVNSVTFCQLKNTNIPTTHLQQEIKSLIGTPESAGGDESINRRCRKRYDDDPATPSSSSSQPFINQFSRSSLRISGTTSLLEYIPLVTIGLLERERERERAACTAHPSLLFSSPKLNLKIDSLVA